MPRQLHLSAALDSPGRFDAAHFTGLARLAERATLDFVTLDDSYTPEPRRLDALATFARLAPVTHGLGLVPTVTTTHTEPFHTSIAVNTLDWVSEGRAGWLVGVSDTGAEARAFGRRGTAPAEELWAEAADAADAASRLWDSWEDDAEIRDTATGRFVDRAKLHHIDFEGPYFSVRGPSITPRPPQGRPVIAVTVAAADLAPDAGPGGRARVATAARHADVVLLDAPDRAARLTAATELRLRGGEALRILARIPVALTTAAATADLLTEATEGGGGVDGFHLVPADPARDLAVLADHVVPALRERGLFRTGYTGRTLRDRLGLARPASRYAATGGAGGTDTSAAGTPATTATSSRSAGTGTSARSAATPEVTR
ncbi:Luciferase-like monooxygenase [Streptomyces sp. TLI_053]|uniref:LLM class flavin-dependent oxidoreductase n=1 Tax=Streptomyces sp. TLI_053 TaxID=1855352 RepID=UPI00087DCA14|nr:LLM class flavin-dependent oxidoreductase [Streptomyces sp. TLI_053]SDT75796.1 Luciferase-like monooxygenase [Streptomyces sp. TLI_053]